jgi:hypothetical protein
LEKDGAVDLIAALIIENSNFDIFQEAVKLGIALLDGGNTDIQVSLTGRRQHRYTGETYWTETTQIYR